MTPRRLDDAGHRGRRDRRSGARDGPAGIGRAGRRDRPVAARRGHSTAGFLGLLERGTDHHCRAARARSSSRVVGPAAARCRRDLRPGHQPACPRCAPRAARRGLVGIPQQHDDRGHVGADGHRALAAAQPGRVALPDPAQLRGTAGRRDYDDRHLGQPDHLGPARWPGPGAPDPVRDHARRLARRDHRRAGHHRARAARAACARRHAARVRRRRARLHGHDARRRSRARSKASASRMPACAACAASSWSRSNAMANRPRRSSRPSGCAAATC